MRRSRGGTGRAGSIDAYAAAVGRWLVTRDGFDFLLYYLSDYDWASHAQGPDAAFDVLARCDASIGRSRTPRAASRSCSRATRSWCVADHGQSRVRSVTRLEERFAGVEGALVAASNRAGQVYLLDGCRVDAAELAARLDGDAAVDVSLRREGGEAVARKDGEELRFAPAATAAGR